MLLKSKDSGLLKFIKSLTLVSGRSFFEFMEKLDSTYAKRVPPSTFEEITF